MLLVYRCRFGDTKILQSKYFLRKPPKERVTHWSLSLVVLSEAIYSYFITNRVESGHCRYYRFNVLLFETDGKKTCHVNTHLV